MLGKVLFSSIPSVILVDARPLQDRDYRFRGVGQHSMVILQALRFHDWGDTPPRIVGLVDPKLEPIADEHRLVFDEITQPGARQGSGVLFLCLSPMTHDPLWSSKYLQDPSVFKMALFYDLIQLQFPHRYLPSL